MAERLVSPGLDMKCLASGGRVQEWIQKSQCWCSVTDVQFASPNFSVACRCQLSTLSIVTCVNWINLLIFFLQVLTSMFCHCLLWCSWILGYCCQTSEFWCGSRVKIVTCDWILSIVSISRFEVGSQLSHHTRYCTDKISKMQQAQDSTSQQVKSGMQHTLGPWCLNVFDLQLKMVSVACWFLSSCPPPQPLFAQSKFRSSKSKMILLVWQHCIGGRLLSHSYGLMSKRFVSILLSYLDMAISFLLIICIIFKMSSMKLSPTMSLVLLTRE